MTVDRIAYMGGRIVAWPALLGALVGLLVAFPAVARAEECPNAAFRQGYSANLPDCRAYEMVTPAGDKGGIDLSVQAAEEQPVDAFASVDGNRLLYHAFGAIVEARSGAGGEYVATREPGSGWQTMPVAPPDAGGVYKYETDQFTDDLSRVSVRALPGTGFFSIIPELEVMFRVGAPGGPMETLASVPQDGVSLVAGADRALRRFVIQAAQPNDMTPPATGVTAGGSLYEVSGGVTRLVGVNNDGTPTSACGSVLPHAATSNAENVNAVSANGNRIFFLSPDPEAAYACGEPPALYMRENGTTTVKVSAPESGVVDPAGAQPVVYAGASEDGTRVYFVTPQWMTAGANGNEPQLYEYDVEAKQLARVSGGPTGAGQGAVDWVYVANKGSAVYFTSRARLTGEEGVEGQPNLYRYDTGSKTYSYITTLSLPDVVYANVGSGFEGPVGSKSIWDATPDGSTLLFLSASDLTGENASGVPELYRYVASTGELRCVSCPPPGAAATGSANVTSIYQLVPMTGRQHHPLSRDGSFVFFDTPDALVPQDRNKARDVYEWHEGAVSLISAGVQGLASFFSEASPDGHDVFFTTHDQLVGWDRDELADVYDARIGGGFPEPPGPASVCSGDECQGAQTTPPRFSAPASTGARAGNPPPPGTRERRASLVPLSVAQLKALARGGVVALRVKVSHAGRVTVVLRAPVSLRGRMVAVGRGAVSATAPQGGVVRVNVRLSALARRALARRGALRVRILTALTGMPRPQSVTVTLHSIASTKTGRRG